MSKVLLLLLFSIHIHAKVLIITHAYNKPEFIEWQTRCFKKFLLDDYEFVVFNDAPPGPMHDSIVAMCAQLHLQCIPIPQEIHNHPQEEIYWETDPAATGTKRHTDGIQYSFDLIGYNHPGPVILIDSDLFIIKPFSAEKSLEHFDIVSLVRAPLISNPRAAPIMHLWPGFSLLAMDRLPNKQTLDYKCGNINGHIVDTGGYTYHYLKNNPSVRFLSIGEMTLDQRFHYRSLSHKPISERLIDFVNMGFDSREIPWLLKYPNLNVEFFFYAHFLHYGEGRYGNPLKSIAVLEFLEQILNE